MPEQVSYDDNESGCGRLFVIVIKRWRLHAAANMMKRLNFKQR